MNRAVNLFALFTLSFALACPVNASLITLGSPADPFGNGYPFGIADFIGVYQQIYTSSAFQGSTSILDVTFYRTQVLTGAYTGMTYTLDLSTTTKSVNNLDLLSWQANLGLNNTVFSQATLAGKAPIGGLTFAGNAFQYDPAAGNLLVTFIISGAGTYSGNDLYFDAVNGTAAGQFSRAMFGFGGGQICCGNDNYGLTTTFTTITSAPEPSTFFLGNSTVASLLLLGFLRSFCARPGCTKAGLEPGRPAPESHV